MSIKPKTPSKRALLLGLIPLLIYTAIEEFWGVIPGLVAGMIFGVGEILWEYRSRRQVDAITWIGNGMLLVLGLISLLTQEGVWFKLQPSLLEFGFAFFLWGSVLMKRSLLLGLAQKQGAIPQDFNHLRPGVGLFLKQALDRMTVRMGLFFAAHGVLAAWAALYWSSAAWVALKGIGFTVSLLVYMVVEMLFLRYRLMSIP